MSDNLTEEQYDKVEQLIDEVCVASVIDGALNGAGEALHDELDKLDIDDDEVRQAVLMKSTLIAYIFLTDNLECM